MSPPDPHAELRAILAHALAEPGDARPADTQRIDAFLQFCDTCGLECVGHERRVRGALVAAIAELRTPGRVSLLMPAQPGAHGIRPAEQQTLLAGVVAKRQAADLCFLQALLPPADRETAGLLARCGFVRVTDVLYLERAVRYPWVEPPDDPALHWTPYAAGSHALFAETLAQSYVASADCPEVSGARTVEDALASHRAAGRWSADMWQAAGDGASPLGCVLTSMPAGGLLEVVYVGVTPAARRRGVGRQLLRRAFQIARQQRCARITTCVDSRNAAAGALYARFGFSEVARRDVYLHFLSRPARESPLAGAAPAPGCEQS